MELQGERLIAASIETTWAALNDPLVLKDCIAGCESLERTSPDTMTAVVALKVGPVSARFKGNLSMSNVQPPHSYTLIFDGQGGVAGFGKGAADVGLSAQGPAQTRLTYSARASVGGKMAQVGSRLIDATAAKITEDFFKAFEARLLASGTPVAQASAPLASARTAGGADGVAKVWWLIGALVAAAVVYFWVR